MSRYWIKLWVELLDDDKAGSLPDNLWRRMVECFLMAGRIDAGGRLPSLRRMAWITHQTEENIATELESLKKLGIVGHDNEGYFVTNFDKRQAPVDVKRRVAEHRRRNAGRNERVTKRYPEVQSTTTTTYLNDKSSSSNSGNDPVTKDVTKRYTDVTDLLAQLDIQDRAQPSRQHAPALVQHHTVTDILANHDHDGAIVANLRRWAAAKAEGKEFSDRPALVWCKIVEGQPPPQSENGEKPWYAGHEDLVVK